MIWLCIMHAMCTYMYTRSRIYDHLNFKLIFQITLWNSLYDQYIIFLTIAEIVRYDWCNYMMLMVNPCKNGFDPIITYHFNQQLVEKKKKNVPLFL